MRTTLKSVLAAIDANNKEDAQQRYQEAVSVIDRMAGRRLIHKNKAARHKSRLNAKVKAIDA